MQLPENAAEANRENHHCDNQYRIDTQCYGLPPPRISVASGTLSQGCKDGGSTARPSPRRWRMTPHWARYAMATIKIPRAMSSPSPSGAPINKPASILLSHSYALGLGLRRASAETPTTRDGRASLYCSPFGASLLGLAGSLLLSRSASACRAFMNASYSGVPGLGGTPLGIPPSHSGA
jgi:hypothetical protein